MDVGVYHEFKKLNANLVLVKGADGATGADGADGADGAAGADGADGADLVNVDYNTEATMIDGMVYTTVNYKREDGTLYLNSVMSNKDTNGCFQTCTLTYYDKVGINIVGITVWTFTYDSNGTIINKVVRNDL